MFYVKAGDQSVVYTGDYNMTPDRHLGAAWMDKVKPDLLITETTYATIIRDSKRVRYGDYALLIIRGFILDAENEIFFEMYTNVWRKEARF